MRKGVFGRGTAAAAAVDTAGYFENYSPSPKRTGHRSTAADIQRELSAEEWTLFHALRLHIQAQSEELLVKDEMGRSLGTAVLQLENELGRSSEQCSSLDQQVRQLKNALQAAQQQLLEASPKMSTLEGRCKELEFALSQSEAEIGKKLQEEISSLKHDKETLTVQMADWKKKVKDALSESKKREQQLVSSEITLQTENKQLQEKLSEMAFQLQASAALTAKQKVAKECQTEAIYEAVSTGDPLQNSMYLCVTSGSPQLDMTSGALRRRRSMREGGRERAASLVFSPTNASGLSDTHSIGLAGSPQMPPALPIRGNSVQQPSDASPHGGAPRFPMPLPTLSPSQLVAAKDNNVPIQNLVSPAQLDEMQANTTPEPAPFIVTVHYSTSSGWSVDSKHRVNHGMTVAQLIQQCASQLNSRYHQSVDPSSMCIRMNHEKAKRSVVLSLHREVHSFAFFQRCQQEGLGITLFLAPRDEMQEHVQQKLRQRLQEEAGILT